jgi:hypothetical protein
VHQSNSKGRGNGTGIGATKLAESDEIQLKLMPHREMGISLKTNSVKYIKTTSKASGVY